VAPFARWFLAAWLGALGAVFAFAALVDPFDVFQWVAIRGVNAEKYEMGGRQAKAIALTVDRYRALVIGTSRAEVGYRTTHPAWRGRPVYNLGLVGTNLFELKHVYDYAVRRQSVEEILFGLDFLAFSSRRTAGRGFAASAFDPGRDPLGLPHLTLSLLGLRRSAATLWRNQRGDASAYWRGHRSGTRSFGEPLRRLGHAGLFERSVRRFLGSDALYRGYDYSAERLARLRAVVEDCRRRGIRLHLVINPVHALQLEVVRAAGLWEAFERWKRDLVGISEAGAPLVTLRDFTGYTGPRAEPLPASGDAAARMRWYYEPSHFTEALGDRVLEEVLLGESAGGEELGVPLAAANVEAHLAGQRADRERFAAAHPEALRRIEEIRQEVERAGATEHPGEADEE
jgi:hypothetical protein